MTVSVLICTYNRHELLRKALQSVLVDAEERPDELVLVNGGDDRADHVLDEFREGTDVHIRHLKTSNINLATSRNLGLNACSGDIIAMTDDDAEVFPDWITRIKALHEELPDAGAIGGAVYGRNVHGLVGRIADLITFPSWTSRTVVRTLPGVNISYKKSVLDEIGMQDVRLFRGEDVDYNWRVLLAGYEVVFDPSMKVWHYHRPTLRGVLRQHYMYGRAYYLVRRKWPAMYSIYPRSWRERRALLKCGRCVLGVVLDAAQLSGKLGSRGQACVAFPLLLVIGIFWRFGMLRQKISTLTTATA
ncbi:MAG: glycosyltransferase [Bacteroidia bacterium]|nr:glycosyltransferase [Bacteroidia bacterium]